MKVRQIAFRVTPLEHQRLGRHANSRGVTVSQFVRDALLESIALHEELPGSSAPDVVSDPNSLTRFLHRTFNNLAESVAKTVESQSTEFRALERDVRLLRAMLDRFYASYLVHTPEISAEIREAAISSGDRRYQQWLREIDSIGVDDAPTPSDGENGKDKWKS